MSRERSERSHEELHDRPQDRARREQARAQAEEHSIQSSARPQDVSSIRAKSTGHKKKTADKWNQ